MRRVVRVTVNAAETITSAALIGVLFLVMLQVVLREVFAAPTTGIIDISSTLLMPLLVLIGLCLTQARKSHIEVSVVHHRLSVQMRRYIDLCNSVLMIALCAILAVATGRATLDALDRGVSTSGQLDIPLAVPLAIAPLAFIMLGIVVLAQLVTQASQPQAGEVEP